MKSELEKKQIRDDYKKFKDEVDMDILDLMFTIAKYLDEDHPMQSKGHILTHLNSDIFELIRFKIFGEKYIDTSNSINLFESKSINNLYSKINKKWFK